MGAPAGIPRYPHLKLWERGLDLVFPPTCAGCQTVGRWICPHCWDSIHWLGHLTCESCGLTSMEPVCRHCCDPRSPIERIVAISEYEGVAREAVHTFKFQGKFAIASVFGRLMAEAATDIDCSAVVPVPLHPARRRERGYDQAELLAKVVARVLDRPTGLRALRRSRRTDQQALILDRTTRLRNVDGAFTATAGLDGENVLLIDDVSSTGATLQSAAQALAVAGAGRVVGLVFAH